MRKQRLNERPFFRAFVFLSENPLQPAANICESVVNGLIALLFVFLKR